MKKAILQFLFLGIGLTVSAQDISLGLGNAILGDNGSGTDTQLLYWNGTNAYYGRNATGANVNNHYFRTYGLDRMTISSSGHVGVGTTSPVDKFHVHNGKLRVSNGGDRMYLKVDDSNSNSVIGFGDDLDDRLDLFFDYWDGTSSDKEVMSLLANGMVGIGTTSPDSKLTVKGNIHAEEVKVDLSVPGPDYVFKEDYDLKSLEEVQDYIKAHGHLPNIPSAKEMEENGLQLGEMNMKLLEKIEELTLYTLEQEKKLKRMGNLEKKVAQMEELINELRKSE